MLDKLLVNVIPITVLFGLGIANTYEDNTVYTTANILIQSYSKSRMEGFFVEKGDKRNVVGNIFYISNIDWCSRLPSLVVKEIPSKPWIAIIRATNNCSCMKKLSTAKEYNATAAILSPAGPSEKHCDESHIDEKVGEIPTSVLLNKKDHNKIIKHYLQQKVPKIECTITKGKNVVEKQFKVSRTSILFVLVSFILLMCISLAWLVFYYVQRFRHIYRNDRKEKQLLSAAKKAISKLKTISFQAGSTKDEEDDSCAVCLENYKDGENIRVLPCKHLFHKSCIDPWLLNHRTCPMCKSNILKSLGVEIPDNIDLSQFDVESRRVSRDHDTVQSTPALPAAPAEEASVDEHHHHHAVPSTSVFTAGDSSSQAWSEPNVVSASCCSSSTPLIL